MIELSRAYVTRNFTCENLFPSNNWEYSGYSEIAIHDKSYESYVWMMQILPNADTESKLDFIDSLKDQLSLYIGSFGDEFFNIVVVTYHFIQSGQSGFGVYLLLTLIILSFNISYNVKSLCIFYFNYIVNTNFISSR